VWPRGRIWRSLQGGDLLEILVAEGTGIGSKEGSVWNLGVWVRALIGDQNALVVGVIGEG